MQTNTYVGLDVHKATIAVSVAEGVRGGEVRHVGVFRNQPEQLAKLAARLGKSGQRLSFCYEAGPCGYGLYRQLTELGHDCMVVAIKWREGAAERLSSRFARVRVRVAHRDYNLTDSRPLEWLLIEWPKGEDAPTKYWLSTLPQDITFRSLVDMTKLRWRIERDYQELKQEVGLGHFEGRGWRGFHHHATLCIAAYGFLVSEREAIPPCGPHSVRLFPQPAVPHGYRPRGSARAA